MTRFTIASFNVKNLIAADIASLDVGR